MSLKAMLRIHYGVQCDEASDGLIAVDKVKQKVSEGFSNLSTASQYKLIFMDINMPNMDGFEATE